MHKATLAEHDGEVAKVESAPQGGHYVWVGGTRHYAGPELSIIRKAGDKIEAGDPLTDGVPKPDEIVAHKGLGEGRHYLVEALHSVYTRAGADVDKRHLETLARSVLNHVYVADVEDGHDHGFLKGDIVNYNRLAAALASERRRVPVNDALGEPLAADILHHTAGTRVTSSIRDALSAKGITHVDVAPHAPRVEPLMRPASRTPLLNSDWMQRLAHRYLKESLLAGAHRGDVSDLHGPSPVPGYAAGIEFEQGPGGTY
jgi:hypothetical protein